MENGMFVNCTNEELNVMYKNMNEENVFADYIEMIHKEKPYSLYAERVAIVYDAFVKEVFRRFFNK